MYEITVDLETTVNGGTEGDSPEAHYPQNKVLLCGYKIGSGRVHVDDTCDELISDMDVILENGDIKLIGHNLKFDLKYLMRDYPDFPWEKLDYHCTMYTDYRDSGHKRRFTSLEDLCTDHGILYKKSLDLGALLASGIKMEDIPRSDLEPYLIDDVVNTQMCYIVQIRGTSGEIYQGHIPALAEIELNGLALDVPMAQAAMTMEYSNEVLHELDIWKVVDHFLCWDDGSILEKDHIKFTAPRTLSYLLTGEPAAGLTKRVRKNIRFSPGTAPLLTSTQITQVWGKKKPTNLGYPISKKEMERLEKLTGPVANLIKAVVSFRASKKLTSTYFGPFLEEAKIQPSVHPKMNMGTTATGRLSSSSPNGQNMPPQARELLHSTEGMLHEIDFKQLEVVALAYLSGDAQLIKDIQDGEDIHYNTGRHVMGWTTPSDMTETSRKLVKNVVFGLIYGGRAAGLAYQTGQPKKLIAQLIKSFYTRYPRVAEWQEEFYTMVVDKMKIAGHKDGEAYYNSNVTCPHSKRRFHFTERPAPKWVKAKTGRSFSFKPTETKNYPVQGFAGGDIVMMALGKLWGKISKYPKTKIRMTVHDSILIDTLLPVGFISSTMRDVCSDIATHYGLPFELTFDIKSGTNWQ